MVELKKESEIEFDVQNYIRSCDIFFNNEYQYKTSNEIVDIIFHYSFEDTSVNYNLILKIYPINNKIDYFEFSNYIQSLMKNMMKAFEKDLLFQTIFNQVDANKFEIDFKLNGIKLQSQGSFFNMDIKVNTSLLVCNLFNINPNEFESSFNFLNDLNVKELKKTLKFFKESPNYIFSNKEFFNDYLKLNMAV